MDEDELTTTFERLATDEAFVSFVDEQFDSARAMASLEELAVWGFGGLEEAIAAWNSRDELEASQ